MESLVECEWRILLSPNCPYHAEIQSVTIAVLAVAAAGLVISSFVLFYQQAIQKRKFLMRDERRFWFLPFRPLSLILAVCVFISLCTVNPPFLPLLFQSSELGHFQNNNNKK